MSISLPQPSGSAKIYATASKEWIIPPKQKPGRKPKAIPKDDLDFAENDTTEHGKKSQNRSAQRAFRERRQTQLSELQARIKQYEQGEVERSVTLQTIGIRLKAENDALKEQNTILREENQLLKARLEELSPALDPSSAAAYLVSAAATNSPRRPKRGRGESPLLPVVSLKRLKITESPRLHVASLNTPGLSSGHSVGSHTQFKDSFMDEQYDALSPITDNGNNSHDPHVAHVSYGMCTSSLDCICRELGIGAPNDGGDITMSLMDNLPPYQPAAQVVPSFSNEITKPYSSTHCSGNPSDCPACKDSEFGRAFCSALGNSVCMLNPCPTCQSKTDRSPDGPEDTIMTSADDPAPSTPLPLTINPTLTQCCGDPGHCKGGACSPAPTPSSKTPSRETSRRRNNNKVSSHERRLRLAPLTTTATDTVPCDVVWRALEAHPNAHLANPIAGPSQLANLNLLADVVARRSYCTLAPGEPTPEPEDFPRRARPPHTYPRSTTQRADGRANGVDISDRVEVADARVTIAYEDEMERDVGSERERMRMVPRELLQGHQRITAVPKEGMRDAIALLDQQFGCS